MPATRVFQSYDSFSGFQEFPRPLQEQLFPVKSCRLPASNVLHKCEVFASRTKAPRPLSPGIIYPFIHPIRRAHWWLVSLLQHQGGIWAPLPALFWGSSSTLVPGAVFLPRANAGSLFSANSASTGLQLFSLFSLLLCSFD